MEKQEREWIAMLLAELTFIGMRDLSEHYRCVMINMDPMLEKEYKACVRTFRYVEKNGCDDNERERFLR